MTQTNEDLAQKWKPNMVIKAAKSAIIADDVEEFLKAGGEIESVEGFKCVAKYRKIYTKEERRKKEIKAVQFRVK